MGADGEPHFGWNAGGGLGTKMGVYVKESDYEQARPVVELILHPERDN